MTKNQLAVGTVSIAAAGVLFWTSEPAYQIAFMVGFVSLATYHCCITPDNKILVSRFVKRHLQNIALKIILPPFAFILWGCDLLPFAKMVTPMKGAHSRAELKQCWSDSWLTAPARFIRARKNQRGE